MPRAKKVEVNVTSEVERKERATRSTRTKINYNEADESKSKRAANSTKKKQELKETSKKADSKTEQANDKEKKPTTIKRKIESDTEVLEKKNKKGRPKAKANKEDAIISDRVEPAIISDKVHAKITKSQKNVKANEEQNDQEKDKKKSLKKEKKTDKKDGKIKTKTTDKKGTKTSDKEHNETKKRKEATSKKDNAKSDTKDDDVKPAKRIKKEVASSTLKQNEIKQSELNTIVIEDSKRLSKNNEKFNVKICSWNVDGVRAWVTKKGHNFFEIEKPDIICLQEIRCPSNKIPEELNLQGYHRYTNTGQKEGYAGVAVFSKLLARNAEYSIGNEEFDEEGRIVTIEYLTFYLVCVYVPNAGRGLVTLSKRLKWNQIFSEYVKKLDAQKPVIICGDMNVAHNEIDLTNPRTNKKNAGFTPEERQGMTEFLGQGFVDTFRFLYPDKKEAYTFWSYMKNCRSKNIGWRLDYFLISERMKDQICDCVIRDTVLGSDHCPITLFIYIRNWPEQFKSQES